MYGVKGCLRDKTHLFKEPVHINKDGAHFKEKESTRRIHHKGTVAGQDGPTSENGMHQKAQAILLDIPETA